MSFNSFQRRPTSRAVWSRHGGGHGWQGGGRRHQGRTWRPQKKSPKRSQMTSCDLIQFSITVSSNHRERRERMKGRQRRRWTDEGIFLGGGGGVTTQHGCVWNAIKSGTEPQGVSPHSHVAANPTDALHLWEGWHVCIHVVYFILHAVWQQGLLITHCGCVRMLLFFLLLPQHLQN